MSYLLTTKWEDMSGNERSEALRLAEQAGIAEAAADAAAAGGVEVQTPSSALYYRRLVEFADESEIGLDDLDGDPRVAAFGRGWTAEQADRSARSEEC